MYATAVRQIFLLFFIAICLGNPARITAQTIDDPVSASSGDSGQEETGPKRGKAETRYARSLGDSFRGAMRSPVGASISFLELYTPDLAGTSKRPYTTFTLVRPELFAHKTTGRYEFQFDYTFGYRRNNHDKQNRSSDHSAKIDLARRVSRNVSIQFTDSFRSIFNDESVLPDTQSPVLYQ